jgi:hypothetical protein
VSTFRRDPLVIVALLVLLVPLAGGAAGASPIALQSPRDADCSEWRECRQLALAAADRRDFETFHDLAWRTVQKGPPKDPALMYLLARAQALSGRPHDALVMLRRLAEMGVPSDGDTNEEFSLTRQLPEWPDVSALINRVSRSDTPPPAAAPTPARESPRPAAAPSSALPPSPPREAVRFSTGGFRLGGLAYDAVSQRFLFGDRLGRKLIVVGDGSHHAVDFVRADSAGFHEISAMEIDSRRGDLWVASGAPANGAGTLHKLQLVSGRPLKSFGVAADLEPVALVDLAVTPAGAVLVLDSAGRQLLVLRAGGTTVERLMRIEAQEPASLATGADEGIAYVAHRDGVSRIDLRAGTAARLTAPGSVSLARLERIRWRRQALVAIRAEEDGSRRIVRFDLNASGRAVTQATPLEGPVTTAGPTFMTIAGDELVYLVDGAGDAAGRPVPEPPGVAEFVAYRVRLR